MPRVLPPWSAVWRLLGVYVKIPTQETQDKLHHGAPRDVHVSETLSSSMVIHDTVVTVLTVLLAPHHFPQPRILQRLQDPLPLAASKVAKCRDVF